ncbi:phosphodiesterase [Endozoicomonadaceae bacterium StTr2]
MTASSAKLIWFTDPQLIPAGRINYDIDPLARLDACLDRIEQDHPDADGCVVTGDLTHWGEESAYKLLAQRLSLLNYPVYLIPGNHDDRDLLAQYFPDLPVTAGDYVQFSVPVGDTHLVFLDTLDDGKRGGRLCQARLNWLQQQMELTSGPLFLFMHHPPLAVGIPNMDKDALANADDFVACIEPYKERIAHLFFGHLHRHVNGCWNGISFSCLPSLVHQTPMEMENDKPGYVSPEPPVYGVIQLQGKNVLVHSHAFMHDVPRINSRTCQRYQP